VILMSIQKRILIVFCCLFLQVFYSQTTNTEVIAKIKTEKVADIININATAKSTTQLIKSLRYEMLVIKTNRETSNTSRSQQSGRFVLESNETKEVATTSINQNIKDKVTVLLLIYDTEDKLLGKDRFVVLNDDSSEQMKEVVVVTPPKEDDYVGFRGIVTEETKTKPGRDFYKLFYSEYLLKGINGKRIVKIIESISLGRNTVLEVRIDNTTIYRFNVIPRADYLKQQSSQAIRIVSRFFQNLEKQKSYVSQNN